MENENLKKTDEELVLNPEDAAGAETEFLSEETESEDISEEIAEEPPEENECKETSEEEASGTEKEGIGQKIKNKFSKKSDPKEEKASDQLLRLRAEFENFRKRTEKEKSTMFEFGARSVIEKILPIVDNFERGMSTVTEEELENPFVQGMDKIYKQLLCMFDELEVKPIKAVGEEFNPDFHNAVMQVEDENAGENIVVEEFQKGYTYRDTVVRYSMVKVNK